MTGETRALGVRVFKTQKVVQMNRGQGSDRGFDENALEYLGYIGGDEKYWSLGQD